MTSLYNIGLTLVAVTLILVLVQPAEADDDVKRKRVIIKIPQRVKHIYHHHTKKVHIKKKQKPMMLKKKKPHKQVRVVAEEEEIVHPIKSWKPIHQAYKAGKEGWSGWKGCAPSSFKERSKRRPSNDCGGTSGSKHYEEDFELEGDHETHESRHYGKGSSSYRGEKSSSSSSRGMKGKKKGGRSSNYSFKHFDDPSYDASYEVVHHDIEHDGNDHEYELPRRNPKPKKSTSPSFITSSSLSNKPKKGYSYRTSHKKPTKRPYFEDKHLEPEQYDDLYDRGPAAYPERKEHPSWRERSRDLGETQRGSYQRPSIWTIPKVPEVNEFIDDTNDVPDPVVTYHGNTGGFYPSNFNPITTITASVVQNSPANPPNGPQTFNPIGATFNQGRAGAPATRLPHRYEAPMSVIPKPIKSLKKQKNPGYQSLKKQKKNPGYLSQVSTTSDGQTISYQSHVGHSSDSPSSSFQEVVYYMAPPDSRS